jgi:hypothetical protein
MTSCASVGISVVRSHLPRAEIAGGQAHQAVILSSAQVARANWAEPPDAILGRSGRTGDRPFDQIGEVKSVGELHATSDRYKEVAGFSPRGPERRGSWPIPR